MTISLGVMVQRSVPPEQELDQARALAQLVDEIWIVEDLGYAGGIAQLAAILATTTDVIVGHGIAPAPFRNVAALAMEWATLARMFPGRVHGGIGHGVGEWMSQIGEQVDSPLTLLAETIEAVRTLMVGEQLNTNGRYVTINDLTLEFPAEIPMPVSAGVRGPKSFEVSGRHADGTILAEGTGPEDVRRARSIIGGVNDGSNHRLTVFVGYYCGDLANLPPRPPHLPEGFDAVGSDAGAVAASFQELVDAGTDSIVLVPFGAPVVEQVRVAVEEIWPLVQPRL